MQHNLNDEAQGIYDSHDAGDYRDVPTGFVDTTDSGFIPDSNGPGATVDDMIHDLCQAAYLVLKQNFGDDSYIGLLSSFDTDLKIVPIFINAGERSRS